MTDNQEAPEHLEAVKGMELKKIRNISPAPKTIFFAGHRITMDPNQVGIVPVGYQEKSAIFEKVAWETLTDAEFSTREQEKAKLKKAQEKDAQINK